jgi:hypothetical protein
MTETPITAAPGICFSESYYAVSRNNAFVSEGAAYRQGQNRWDNGYNVEFYAGYAQKIAGWGQATSSTTTGIPRCIITWRDNNAAARVAIGTENHLYYMSGTTLTDITPLRSIATGTIGNLITTTINSNLAVITDTAAQVQVGDWVFLSAASAVGGMLLNQWYNVEAISAGVSYTVTVSGQTASSSAGPGGGTITFDYPRITLGSAPFTTTNGSPTVKVTHTAHGAATGNFVSFSGATAVAGLTISGEYQIGTIVDANHYDITASGNANTGTTGGGTAVSVIYPVPLQQLGSVTGGVGYGNAAYGSGSYQGISTTSNPSALNGWTLSAYGNQLLSCPIGGTIFIFDPVLGGRSYPMLNAPSACNAMFVTPERFVVALGLNNTMQIAWSDQTDYTQWVTTNINTAETSRTIVGGSTLIAGLAVKPGQSLFWSDRCCFSMTYNGGQFVYTTQQIGDNCGLVSPTAMCSAAGIAYWMSDRDFFTYNGSVTPMPSDDIRSYVYSTINTNSLSKATATLNRAKKQVRFYYPAGSATENGVGMIFQYDTQCWSPLNFGRSCATDANLLSNPISADQTKKIYTDESGTDANGAALAWSLQLGMSDISNGDRNVDVFGFTPDFQTLVGSPSLTILTQYYPQIAVVSDGPYVLTTATTRQDLRSDGKLFGFSLSDNEIGSNFRLGTPRLDIQPAGARR